MNDTEHAETIENTEKTDAVTTLNSTSELADFLKENDGKIVILLTITRRPLQCRF